MREDKCVKGRADSPEMVFGCRGGSTLAGGVRLSWRTSGTPAPLWREGLGSHVFTNRTSAPVSPFKYVIPPIIQYIPARWTWRFPFNRVYFATCLKGNQFAPFHHWNLSPLMWRVKLAIVPESTWPQQNHVSFNQLEDFYHQMATTCVTWGFWAKNKTAVKIDITTVHECGCQTRVNASSLWEALVKQPLSWCNVSWPKRVGRHCGEYTDVTPVQPGTMPADW